MSATLEARGGDGGFWAAAGTGFWEGGAVGLLGAGLLGEDLVGVTVDRSSILGVSISNHDCLLGCGVGGLVRGARSSS